MIPLDLTWPGGHHRFLFELQHIRALETTLDAGPSYIRHLLSSDQWKSDHLIQVLRFGLEGGGMEGPKARELAERTVCERPRACLEPAIAILMAWELGTDFKDPDTEEDEESEEGEPGAAADG